MPTSHEGVFELPIISAKSVTKTYDTGSVRVEALRGISLDIEAGEFVAIMGPSGCGKTTLLNCFSGLDSVTSGSIWLEGTDLSSLSDNKKSQYRAQHMGFIFQFYNLLPVLTAVENIEMPLLISGIKPKESRRRATAALEQVNLTEWAKHRPAELSGGQRQRVTIARALVNNPKIVWGDEPTGDLDSDNAEEIMDLMVHLNKENRQTFVTVTHDPAVAARAKRLIRMKDGLIISDSPQGNNTAVMVQPSGGDTAPLAN